MIVGVLALIVLVIFSIQNADAVKISFLGAPASALSAISVVGSSSGRHSGRLHSYASAMDDP